jgi:hypothetical protein
MRKTAVFRITQQGIVLMEESKVSMKSRVILANCSQMTARITEMHVRGSAQHRQKWLRPLIKLQAGHYVAPGPLFWHFLHLAVRLASVQPKPPSSAVMKANGPAGLSACGPKPT